MWDRDIYLEPWDYLQYRKARGSFDDVDRVLFQYIFDLWSILLHSALDMLNQYMYGSTLVRCSKNNYQDTRVKHIARIVASFTYNNSRVTHALVLTSYLFFNTEMNHQYTIILQC